MSYKCNPSHHTVFSRSTNTPSRNQPRIHRPPTSRRRRRLGNLPSRTLGRSANFAAQTRETLERVLKRVKTNKTGKMERYELVTFKTDDLENPKDWSKALRVVLHDSSSVYVLRYSVSSAVVTADIRGMGSGVPYIRRGGLAQHHNFRHLIRFRYVVRTSLPYP